MQKEMTTKEEARGGVVFACFFVTLIVLVLFGWSPVSYYLGHWSNYWDGKDPRHTSTTETELSPVTSYYSDARNACYKRAVKYFGTDEVNADASSTDETTAFKTYDCYGVKFTKIP